MTNPHLFFSRARLVRYVLIRERCFDTKPETYCFRVAGFPFQEGPRIIERLVVGDPLDLLREPENPHDDLAVAAYHHDDKIGYMPRKQNKEIAERLDQSVPYECRIAAVKSDEGPSEVEIVCRLRLCA